MNEISAKFKRQIEILGIAIKNTESLGITELAQMYGVERLTIKRDLQALRKHGIDVHSEGKRGVRLSSEIDASRVQKLVSSYLALSSVGASIDKASELLTKKLGIESLGNVVALQRCIDDGKKVKISYEEEKREGFMDFVVDPIQIFQSDALWRLLAVHEGVIKQLLLTKIVSVNPLETAFKRPTEARIHELFQNSFITWTGDQKHTVRLRLSKDMAKRLRSRQLISFDTMEERKDGSLDLSGVVNSIEELAIWVAGLEGAVVALAPRVLIERVRAIARKSYEAHR